MSCVHDWNRDSRCLIHVCDIIYKQINQLVRSEMPPWMDFCLHCKYSIIFIKDFNNFRENILGKKCL